MEGIFEFLKGFDIINDLSRLLHRLVTYKKSSARVSQVKEKSGTLRFYMDSSTECTDKLSYYAEAMSEITCESCGDPGILREGGWISTLCDECAKPKKG